MCFSRISCLSWGFFCFFLCRSLNPWKSLKMEGSEQALSLNCLWWASKVQRVSATTRTNFSPVLPTISGVHPSFMFRTTSSTLFLIWRGPFKGFPSNSTLLGGNTSSRLRFIINVKAFLPPTVAETTACCSYKLTLKLFTNEHRWVDVHFLYINESIALRNDHFLNRGSLKFLISFPYKFSERVFPAGFWSILSPLFTTTLSQATI